MPKRKDISQESINKAIKLLSEDQTLSLTKVINKLNLDISRQCLAKKLKQNGYNDFSKNAPNISKIYSDEEIIKLYNEMIKNGDSLMNFCKAKNISHTTFSDRLKYLNLPYTSILCKNIDHFYFDNLNKENVYWLGLLLADGYISKNDNAIELGLKDKDHIEKFKNCLHSDHKINKKLDSRWNTYMYRLKFHSERIKNRLIQLGIEPQKTYKSFNIPNEIMNSNFISDFIRGFFDGDGHISEGNNGELQQVGFTSYDNNILIELQTIIYNNLNIEFKQYVNNEGIHYLSNYKNGDKEKFLNWIYKDSEIYLERKYKRYLKHCRLE